MFGKKKKTTKILEAVKSKNLESLKRALSRRGAKEDILVEDDDEMCPLVCAIRINQPVMVQELLRFYLENGVPINSTNRSGYTALHVACSEQNLDERILTGLLKFPGIDVCAQNSDGNTPLHCFCEKFSSPMCQEYVDIFLSMGADINCKQLW